MHSTLKLHRKEVNKGVKWVQTAIQILALQEGKSPIGSHALVYMLGHLCFPRRIDNQHISVTERAVDHKGIAPLRPRSPDKI